MGMPLGFYRITCIISTRPTQLGCFSFGEEMSHATDVEETQAEDIDEALRHLSLVPPADRGDAWHAYMDALLEKRNRSLTPEFSDRR